MLQPLAVEQPTDGVRVAMLSSLDFLPDWYHRAVAFRATLLVDAAQNSVQQRPTTPPQPQAKACDYCSSVRFNHRESAVLRIVSWA
jgi:hypothetical protein